MSIDSYYDEKSYRKAVKEYNKMNQAAMRDVKKLKSILCQHYDTNENSVYGEKDIHQLLLNNPDIHKRWPECSFLIKTMYDSPQSIAKAIEQHYQTQFDKMAHDYVKSMIDQNIMDSYESVRCFHNFIDISKMEISTTDHDVFKNEDIEKCRAIGNSIFTPCFNEATIRFKNQTYIHYKIVGKTQNSIHISCQKYYGDKHDWMMNWDIDFELNFEPTSNDETPGVINVFKYDFYENILTKNIENMGWTEKQINLWKDMFEVYHINDAVMVNANIDEINVHTIMYLSKTQYYDLKKLLNGTDCTFEVLADNPPEIERGMASSAAIQFIVTLIQKIAYVNFKLHTCNWMKEYFGTKPNGDDTILFYKKDISDDNKEQIFIHIGKLKIVTDTLNNIDLPQSLKG